MVSEDTTECCSSCVCTALYAPPSKSGYRTTIL